MKRYESVCVLGGAGLPDIGAFFPPDDPAFHTWDPADFAVVLDVGPGQALAGPGAASSD